MKQGPDWSQQRLFTVSSLLGTNKGCGLFTDSPMVDNKRAVRFSCFFFFLNFLFYFISAEQVAKRVAVPRPLLPAPRPPTTAIRLVLPEQLSVIKKSTVGPVVNATVPEG